MDIIKRTFDSTLISQRQVDGYLNATEMCKANNKTWSNYIRLDSTKAYYKALSSVLHIRWTDLIQSRQGGSEQGTWIHPKAAIHLASWLSPEFSVQVTEWAFEILSKGVVDIRGESGHTASSGKLLTWDGLASEDALSEMIHSFCTLAGFRLLEREYPFLDITNKLKTRRLDFIIRLSKLVFGLEIKLKQFTLEDVINTLNKKCYYDILNSAIHKFDTCKQRKIRKVKFILMSPLGITDEAEKLLKTIPNVEFISVQDFCAAKLRQALKKKYKLQPWYLINLAKNKYAQLFNAKTLELIQDKYS